MDELNNALAWFKAAPTNFYKSGKEKLEGTAQWIWEVIQGDFNEEQSAAQVVTGTVISMIPFVDQICDVRDVVANCKKINQDSGNKWHWVALALTLIGLIPTLGSLVKGCFKVLLAYGRKGVLGAGAKALDSGMWKAMEPWVESGILKFNEFLGGPEVRRTLLVMKIDNPYKYIAQQLREVAGSLSVSKLLAAFDQAIKVFNDLITKVQKWGPASMGEQARALVAMMQGVRNKADQMLAQVLGPTVEVLNRLARRLDIEADMHYRAATNSLNPHAFTRPSLDAARLAMRREIPPWVDKGPNQKYLGMRKAPKKEGWFTLTTNQAKNCHTAVAVEYPPGSVLYRVVDPGSRDNSDCWMNAAEFAKLESKDEWRRRFAVWGYWNRNGEYVTYTVPPGKPLRAWEGVTASQKIDDAGEFVLEGGARQILLNPADLNKAYTSKRQATGWGYANHDGESVSLVGVPVLTNNWPE